MSVREPDVALGEWVYCKGHVGPHATGWCSVSVDQKVPLRATTREEALQESWAIGRHIYGYCDVCHKWVCNEPWYPQRRFCPSHDEWLS